MCLSPIQLLEKFAGVVFSRFWLEKMVCGEVAFLLVFLGFWVCFVMVNCGEFVVGCVANVVC
jgi:hypothetical protein